MASVARPLAIVPRARSRGARRAPSGAARILFSKVGHCCAVAIAPAATHNDAGPPWCFPPRARDRRRRWRGASRSVRSLAVVVFARIARAARALLGRCSKSTHSPSAFAAIPRAASIRATVRSVSQRRSLRLTGLCGSMRRSRSVSAPTPPGRRAFARRVSASTRLGRHTDARGRRSSLASRALLNDLAPQRDLAPR